MLLKHQKTPVLLRIGITYTQYIVMMVLWEHGSVSSRDPEEERLLIVNPNITGMNPQIHVHASVSALRQHVNVIIFCVR